MRPAKYKQVCEKMKTLVNHTVYSEFIYEPSVAYTYSRTKSLRGTVYRIFVNNKDTQLAQYLYLHECGHIIFGHVKNMDLRMDRFLGIKLNIAYKQIAHYFPNYDEYLNVFKTAVFNIVMDFEVNSRLFNSEEWVFMNKRLSVLLGKPNITGMWPQDYGYAPGLTWNEYLTQILLNPKKFMKQFHEYLKQQCGENSPKKGKEEKLTEKQLGKLEEIEKLHGKGTFSNERRKRWSTLDKYVKEQSLDIYSDTTDLFKKIAGVLEYKNQMYCRLDSLYNYNRRKHNTNVLISKQLKEEVLQPRRLFILFDVSGSVDLKLVNGLIRTFKDKSKLYTKTQFVTWNTALVQEWNIKENICCKFGGGTQIASGIAYLNNRYKLGAKDLIFVISDFCDNLFEWQKELKKVKAEKYAINWKSWYMIQNPGFKKIFQYIDERK